MITKDTIMERRKHIITTTKGHDHNHEGHDHEKENHDHENEGHEGHNHEAEASAAGHSDEIILAPEKAKQPG